MVLVLNLTEFPSMKFESCGLSWRDRAFTVFGAEIVILTTRRVANEWVDCTNAGIRVRSVAGEE